MRMTDNASVPDSGEVTSEFRFEGTVMDGSDGVNHYQSTVSVDPLVAISETAEMMTSVLPPLPISMETSTDRTSLTH
jgi:hypothetical protein